MFLLSLTHHRLYVLDDKSMVFMCETLIEYILLEVTLLELMSNTIIHVVLVFSSHFSCVDVIFTIKTFINKF